MNLQEYKVRLDILLEQKVISLQAYKIAQLAFEKLQELLNKSDIEQSEMLFTHLPMAITRISNGEEVERPLTEIVNEIKSSRFFSIAEEQVAFIEEKLGSPLPQGEKEFLYIHYSNVFNINN